MVGFAHQTAIVSRLFASIPSVVAPKENQKDVQRVTQVVIVVHAALIISWQVHSVMRR